MQKRILDAAIAEARAAGYVGKNIMGSGFDVGNLDPSRRRRVHLRRGDRAARIARGQARVSAQPAAVSRDPGRVRMSPTVVNNVETLSNIPHIINRGAEWYKSDRSREEPRPEAVLPLGSRQEAGPLRTADGLSAEGPDLRCRRRNPRRQRSSRRVIPGGSSFPVFTAEEAIEGRTWISTRCARPDR